MNRAESCWIAERPSNVLDLHAWELRLAKEGFIWDNHRVGDRGGLYVFTHKHKEARLSDFDSVIEQAAEDIERILES